MLRRESKQNIESLISPGVEIRGKIVSEGSIRVDGLVEGELNIKGDLFIGTKGLIKGDVRAENIVLSGKIEGNLNANGKLEITSTGSVIGDAVCSILTIEEGGILDGTSKMGKSKELTRGTNVENINKNKQK